MGIATMPKRYFSPPTREAKTSLPGHGRISTNSRRSRMSKTLAVALATLVVCVTPAAAAMDCGKMLDTHTAEISKMEKVSSEKRAALTRMAISGYDSCMAGDTFSAEKFFKMIMGGG
jgi:hypothetical protein